MIPLPLGDSGRAQTSLSLRPISIRRAKKFVGIEHRHHPKVTGAKWCLAAYLGERLVGVTMVGIPKAQKLAEDERRQEITRLATDGTRNACSFLYGASARVARTMGVLSLRTYTAEDEPGDTLRAVGAKELGLTDGGEWDRSKRRRAPAKNAKPKRRWELLHETAHLLNKQAVA